MVSPTPLLPSVSFCLLLLSLTVTVVALSSTSPQDLYAQPRYHVYLSSDPLTNSTATALLSTPFESAQEDGKDAPLKYHLMKSATSGQTFLCSVPSPVPIPKQALSPSHKLKRREFLENQKLGLERGLQLLEPLKGSCLYYRLGWFTCAFLHFFFFKPFSNSVSKQIHSVTDRKSDNFMKLNLPMPIRPRPKIPTLKPIPSVNTVLRVPKPS